MFVELRALRVFSVAECASRVCAPHACTQSMPRVHASSTLCVRVRATSRCGGAGVPHDTQLTQFFDFRRWAGRAPDARGCQPGLGLRLARASGASPRPAGKGDARHVRPRLRSGGGAGAPPLRPGEAFPTACSLAAPGRTLHGHTCGGARAVGARPWGDAPLGDLALVLVEMRAKRRAHVLGGHAPISAPRRVLPPSSPPVDSISISMFPQCRKDPRGLKA